MEYHWIVVQLVRDFMLLVTASLLSRQLPYVTITLTVRSLRTRKGEKTATPRSLPIPPPVLEKQDSRTVMPAEEATIIVKSVGKVAFLPLFFLPPLAPGPMLSKTLIFVHVIGLLYPNIELGKRGIFSKRENSLLLLSCTTFPTIFVCDCRSRLKKAEYATCTSPIMHLICPAKFCITFVFLFLLGIAVRPKRN